MTFVPGQVLTAAELNVLDITSLTVDTDTLVVDATNDRVGINQASPSVALDVGGSVVIDDTLAVDTDTLFTNGAGQVGIGTTTPTANHVLHTHGAVLISSTTGVGNSHFPFTDGRFYYTADPETGGIGDHVFRHYSGGSYVERMRILEGGKVGIGTTVPVAGLDIATTAGDTFTANGWDSGLILNAASALRWRTASGVDWGMGNSGSSFYIFSSTDSGTGAPANYRIVIDSNGDVGIGTTTPAVPLHVQRFSSSEVLRLQNASSNDQGPYISLFDYNSRVGYLGFPNNDDLHVKNETSAGRIYLSTNNTTRMTVRESGNVGIGTTDPTQKLDVNGNLRIRTGVDGGIEFRPWTASSSYNSMANTNHTGGEYTMLTTASATFISVGAGGSVNIRPNGNEVSGLSVQTTGTFIIAKFPGVSGYLTVRRRSSDGLLGYASSSQRYKENIVDADDTWRQIYNLRPRDFDWRESMFDTDPDGVPDDRSDYGLIAEEAHLVMPSIVDWAVPNVETEVDEHNEPIPPETPPDPIIESVDYEKLSRYFLPAIQDLNARVATLEDA